MKHDTMYPAYPRYKPSGLQWLPMVPSDWLITKTKYVVPFTTGWTPPTGNDASYEGENLWANISDLGPKILTDTAKRISDGAVRVSRIKVSPQGSLLFSFKLSIGQVSFAGRDMFTNEAIATFLPSSTLSLDYAYFAFPLLLIQNADENIYGAKLLNQELIRSAMYALPSLLEQKGIAAFLDRETAKIDALILKQGKLINLLIEKRQVVISHAATKGINSDVIMAASGIKWLDQIPHHWKADRVKNSVVSITSGSRGWAEYYSDQGAIFIRITNLSRIGVDLDFSDTQFVQPPKGMEANRSKASMGDIVVSITADLGSVAVVPELHSEAYVSQHVALMKPKPTIHSRWLALVIRSQGCQEQLAESGYGGTKIQLSLADVTNLWIAVPPFSEQQAIADFLDRETAKIDALIEKAKQSIELMKERRSALMSAAVTGKIDVRQVG